MPMDPNETVRTRTIRVTAENLHQVAKDISMSPTELELLYENHTAANVPLTIVIKEPDVNG